MAINTCFYRPMKVYRPRTSSSVYFIWSIKHALTSSKGFNFIVSAMTYFHILQIVHDFLHRGFVVYHKGENIQLGWLYVYFQILKNICILVLPVNENTYV